MIPRILTILVTENDLFLLVTHPVLFRKKIFPVYTFKFIHLILYPLYIHSDPIRIPFIFHQHVHSYPLYVHVFFHYITLYNHYCWLNHIFGYIKSIPLLYSNEIVIIHPDSHYSIPIAVRSHSCSINNP